MHFVQADLELGWPGELAKADIVLSFGSMQALATALAGVSEAPAARLVATSSMSVESKRDASFAEDRALAASLAQAEKALIAQCERLGMGWTLLRPTMIYGLGRDQNLTPIARRAVRTRLFPWPLGRGLRQPVHAEDVAQAAWRAAQSPQAAGKIYPLGGGEVLTASRMFARVWQHLPRRALPVPLPGWLLRALAGWRPGLRGALSRLEQNLVADNRAIQTELGIAPRPFIADVAAWLERDDD